MADGLRALGIAGRQRQRQPLQRDRRRARSTRRRWSACSACSTDRPPASARPSRPTATPSSCSAEAEPWLGGSLYLASRHGDVAGRLPRLDLDAEARLQRLLVDLAAAAAAALRHDLSDGGLAVALAESAILGASAPRSSLPPSQRASGGGAVRRGTVARAGLGRARAAGRAARGRGGGRRPAEPIGRVGGERLRVGAAIDLVGRGGRPGWENGLELAGVEESE